jgi:hypothetical protein
MPLNNLRTRRYGLRALTGKNPGHEIGTGFGNLAEDMDEINQGQQDLLQAGVVGESWTFTATVNASTGQIGATAELPASVAWLPDTVVSEALTRTLRAKGAFPVTGFVTVAPGQYASCAVELEMKEPGWGVEPALTTNRGGEYATQAEAEAHPPSVASHAIQLRRLLVHNKAGSYEILAQEDVRPWAATGAWIALELGPKVRSAGGVSTTPAVRSTSGGSKLEFRGEVEVKTGETLSSGELVFTMPASIRSLIVAKERTLMLYQSGTSEVRGLAIPTTGKATLIGAVGVGVAANKVLVLDGVVLPI